MPRSRNRRKKSSKRPSHGPSRRRHRGGDEWIGGRLPAPFYVEDRDEPYRPHLVLWMDSHELVVGQELIEPEEDEDALARVLLTAMERPLVGPRRRPDAIRVANLSHAAPVGAVAGNRIPIRVAPTPELGEFLEVMARSMPVPNDGGNPSRSYLRGGRIPPETVAELFEAAELLYRTSPWTAMFDDRTLRLDIPAYEVEGACVSVIGNLGESRGILVFPSFAHYRAFVAASDPASGTEGGRLDLGTSWLSLSFERGADLPVLMRREVAEHAWPTAAAGAYPVVGRFDPDGVAVPLRPRDLRVAAATAVAVSRFFAAHREALERGEFDSASESYAVPGGVEVHVAAPDGPPWAAKGGLDPAAFEPAPGDDRRPHPLHELDHMLFQEIADFAMTSLGESLRGADRVFADASQSLELAAPWLVYHHRVNGETALEGYLRASPRPLTSLERDWLEAQRAAWLSVWEVFASDPGKGLSLRDLLTGEERFVHETKASTTLVLRDAVLGRVVNHAGGSLLGGVHPRPLPPREAAEVVRQARRRLRRRHLAPVGRLRDEAIGRYLIQRWEEAVDALDVQASTPRDLRNTDGDLLLLTTDHFRIEPSARPQVEAALATIEGVEPPAGDDSAYVFLPPPAAGLPQSRQDTIIGHARVTDTSPRLDTNSRERADALRARVEAACGGHIRFQAREHAGPTSDAAPLLPAAPAGGPGAEPPEEVLQEFKRRHYPEWPDHPLPALNGASPREAVRTAAGRDAVDTLLKEMENHEQRTAPRSAFDFSVLRGDLGIE